MMNNYTRKRKHVKLTFDTPILFGVTQHHDEFIGGKYLQVISGEDFGESFSECLRLHLCTFANNCINDCRNIFIDIINGDSDVSPIRLKAK